MKNEKLQINNMEFLIFHTARSTHLPYSEDEAAPGWEPDGRRVVVRKDQVVAFADNQVVTPQLKFRVTETADEIIHMLMS